MIVDEMEMVSRLKDVEPLRPEAFEQARMVLRAAMADSGPELASARVSHRRRTLLTRGRVGLGIGATAVAAAAAVALVATSTPQPAANADRPPAASRSASASASASAVVNAQLMSVADVIKSHEGPLPGNASLIIRTQTNGNYPPAVNYDLYTDSGDYYWGMTKAALLEAVTSHDNPANGFTAREVAAALYAANGDLATARVRMINATPNPFGLGDTPAQKKALEEELKAALKAAQHSSNPSVRRKVAGYKDSGPDTGKALQQDYDNYIWDHSMDALTAGGGNPQVRIGVLRLLATVPEVTVKNSTTDGKATLTLTASNALFSYLDQQVLTINASTGMPISLVLNIPGKAPDPTRSVITYHVSRLTLADIKAGKF